MTNGSLLRWVLRYSFPIDAWWLIAVMLGWVLRYFFLINAWWLIAVMLRWVLRYVFPIDAWWLIAVMLRWVLSYFFPIDAWWLITVILRWVFSSRDIYCHPFIDKSRYSNLAPSGPLVIITHCGVAITRYGLHQPVTAVPGRGWGCEG